MKQAGLALAMVVLVAGCTEAGGRFDAVHEEREVESLSIPGLRLEAEVDGDGATLVVRAKARNGAEDLEVAGACSGISGGGAASPWTWWVEDPAKPEGSRRVLGTWHGTCREYTLSPFPQGRTKETTWSWDATKEVDGRAVPVPPGRYHLVTHFEVYELARDGRGKPPAQLEVVFEVHVP